jgi:hypothetical protein
MENSNNKQDTINSIHVLTAVINANKGVESGEAATEAALKKIEELIDKL